MKIRHGLTNTRVHLIWRNMKYRCNTISSPLYKNYGARGIRVCKRWSIFENFLKDMGHPPTRTHSLDRINGLKGYSKGNCRWATPREQMANIKTNKHLTLKGEIYNEREWCRRLKINRSTLRGRLRQGWSVEKALTTSVNQYTKGDAK